MASRYIVGIDLGTTHTVVAFVDAQAGAEARPEIFPIEQLVAAGEVEARALLPSARYHAAEGELPGGRREVVGQLALELGAKVPGRLVTSAKSWLSHAAVDRTAAILPWGAPEDVPKISPLDASASYLVHVREAWDRRFPDHPLAKQDLVLTVPASFDEGARALTVRAAREAGLEKIRLVEEPQAAFYDWLAQHRDTLEQDLKGVKLAIVVDVGGGTTDLTLIQVELRESGPRLTRIAVGDHLMLGGDNMDLALAKLAEQRIVGEGGAALPAGRFSQLLAQARTAKETLLGLDAPAKIAVTVLGSGSKLVGGTKSTELTRDEVERVVVDGFFPRTAPNELPSKRRGAIVEFGLPYVADPAITRHLAAFLARHADVAREALGTHTDASRDAIPVPDAVLLNGGVFRGAALEQRLREVLDGWRGSPLWLLHNDAPDLAVARGAVAYGLARRGIGVKIGGGSARSYYLVLEKNDAVCVLPRGAEEGEEVRLDKRTFTLKLGRPVRFHLKSSAAERAHRPGEIADVSSEHYLDLPPIAAVLGESGAAAKADARDVPVRVATSLTEVGTLEVSCIQVDTDRRWKLEFQLRRDQGSSAGDLAAPTIVTQLHPRFAAAVERVQRVFGKSSEQVDRKEVKTLRADLERMLGDRDGWDTPLARELFSALFAGAKRRRRSADHERVWLNLTGFCLRPGFGYPLDDWRVKQLWSLWPESVQFAPEAQVWAEWWILWRRVAGGLDEKAQVAIADDLAFYLEPPGPRPKPRPPGPKKLGADDMVRLVGSLERLPADRKSTVGGWLVQSAEAWWAVGRIGARVPFYGSAHAVVPRAVAAEWLGKVLALDWRAVEAAPFAATLLARASGDRERDLDPALREQVAARLGASGAPPSWAQMVREPTRLAAADERRIFGESLPSGLRLVD